MAEEGIRTDCGGGTWFCDVDDDDDDEDCWFCDSAVISLPHEHFTV